MDLVLHFILSLLICSGLMTTLTVLFLSLTSGVRSLESYKVGCNTLLLRTSSARYWRILNSSGLTQLRIPSYRFSWDEGFVVSILHSGLGSCSGSCGGCRYLCVVKSCLIPLGTLSCGISVKIPTRILVFPASTDRERLHLSDI